MNERKAGAKRTLKVASGCAASRGRAMPTASMSEPSARRQRFVTVTRPSRRVAYSAVVLPAQCFWKRFGYLAISNQRPL